MSNPQQMQQKLFVYSGMTSAQNALIMRNNDVFTSEIYDSGSGGMRWNSCTIDLSVTDGSYFRFTAMSSEHLPAEGEEFAAESTVTFINSVTMPLSSLEGRYLMFKLEAFTESGSEIVVNSVRITCPHTSYIEFMPRVFRRLDNGNLRNLLDMYKVVVDNVDEKIVNIDRILSPDSVCGDELVRLAEWVGLDVGLLWGEDKLRRLIKEAYYFNRMKGTSAALSRIIEILIGKAPEIMETENGFTVIIDHEDVPSRQHYREIVRLINAYKPAGVNGRLTLRKPNEKIAGGVITLSDKSGDAVLLSDDGFDSKLIL